MPGVAAALLELGLTRGQVQLIVHDQYFFRRNLEEPRQRRDGLAGQVHERLRLQQPNGVAVHVGARYQAVVAPLGHQPRAQGVGEVVNPPEARVVPRGLVLRAWVAQADEQLDHGVIIRRACAPQGRLRIVKCWGRPVTLAKVQNKTARTKRAVELGR